jgi:hypothetical protein
MFGPMFGPSTTSPMLRKQYLSSLRAMVSRLLRRSAIARRLTSCSARQIENKCCEPVGETMAPQTQELQEVGYIKYSGRDVGRGVIDAGSAGSARIGLDETIRYFNAQQSPDFANLQYDLPITTRSGSWEVIVLGGVGAVEGAYALGYTKKAGEKLAENDFKNIGLKDLLKRSLSAAETLAKIVKHARRARGWEAVRFTMDNVDEKIVLPNDQGEDKATSFVEAFLL